MHGSTDGIIGGLRRLALTLGLGLALLSLAVARPPGSDVYAHTTADGWVIGNSKLQRSFSYGQGHWRTLSFANKVDGRTTDVVSSEFSLDLVYERIGYQHGSANPLTVNTDDFTVETTKANDLPDGGIRLEVHLKGDSALLRYAGGLNVTLEYELHPEATEIRKWIELQSPRARTTYTISKVSVEDMHLPLQPLWPTEGFGQPIFTGDLFWGIEFPASTNRMDGDHLTLSYIDGRILDVQHPYDSETAVLGVAPAGHVEEAFADYVNAIRIRPVRPFVLYNSWYDLQGKDVNQANVEERVHDFRTRGGIDLDSVVLDDGWDDLGGLWHVDPQQFPHGFAPVSRDLQKNGTHLGLWFGPGGGYAQNARTRLANGKKLGLEELAGGQWFCIAGPQYHKVLQDRMVQAVTQWGVNYLKLDGVPFGCNNPNHGHPIGIYSSPALTRSWISMLLAVRKARPDVFINFTTGSWLSPWWLQYADTLWMGGADYGYLNKVPIISPRDAAMTYKDSVLYDDFVRHHDQAPMSSIMTHGIIDGRLNRLGGEHESPLEWTNGIVDYIGQGTMMWELYLTPSILSQDKWTELSQAITWAKNERATLLGSGSMVLGDPAAGEIYGFLHRQPGHTLLVLRNPTIDPGTAKLALPTVVTPQGSGEWQARLIYPWQQDMQRDSTGGLSVSLGGFETALVELDQQPAPLRIFHARAEHVTGAEWNIWRAPDAPEPVLHLETSQGVQVRLDGHTIPVQGSDVTLPVPAATSGLTASDVHVSSTDGWHETAAIQVASSVAEPRWGVLIQGDAAASANPTCQVDGQSVTPQASGPKNAHWRWFFVSLTPGTHHLDCSLSTPVTAQTWLLGRQALPSHRLEIKGLDQSIQKTLTPPQWNNLVPIRTQIGQ